MGNPILSATVSVTGGLTVTTDVTFGNPLTGQLDAEATELLYCIAIFGTTFEVSQSGRQYTYITDLLSVVTYFH